MKLNALSCSISTNAPLIALRVWTRQLGISDVTAWRWSKAGYIHPLNIAGKLYLSADDLAQFEARAKAGEFSKPPAGACAPQKHGRAQ